MTGQEVKEKIRVKGFTEAELARRLGKPQQTLNKALKSQDVKTGLLEELCKVFDVDMSFFYPNDFKKARVVQSINGDNSNNINAEIGKDYEDMLREVLAQNTLLLKYITSTDKDNSK